jgi:hypothetical protein
LRKIITGGIGAALAVSGLVASGAVAAGQGGQPTAWVNGGGQIIASEQQGGGPGDTVAFNAQQYGEDGARGQFQYNQRSAGSGPIHGVVTCAAVDPGARTATFGGEVTQGGTTGFFRVDVTDNGTPAQGTDVVLVTLTDDDDPCNADQGDGESNLGRGNVTIHPAA